MRILMLATYDRGGGAEKVALDLHQSYLEQGHDSRLLVCYKRTDAENVYEIDPYRSTSAWAPIPAALERWIKQRPPFRGQFRLRTWLRRSAYPKRWWDVWRGVEDFNYPYSHQILDDPSWHPDLIHAHNLHGEYFDLRALATLSRKVPVVWTLHDAWALTGHCAHFVDCEHWRKGCDQCPDLRRAPAIVRDSARENLERKKRIYSNSRLAIATPSRWLMNQVDVSILRPWRKRVIPNGVDLTVFHPGDRRIARARLGLPQDAFIVMFISQSVSASNPYKDIVTVERAVLEVSTVTQNNKILFVCLGGDGKAGSDSQVYFVGRVDDPSQVCLYYQASDVLLHAANAENFPCVVLEALACGTPVVATAVGGIPEEILDGEIGFLVPRGAVGEMAQRVLLFMDEADLSCRMGENAASYVRRHFSLSSQSQLYLNWFEELRSEYGLLLQ